MTKTKRTKWTPEMDKHLTALRYLGVKPRDIASTMGLPRSVIYTRSTKLGLNKVKAQVEMELDTKFRESPKEFHEQIKEKTKARKPKKAKARNPQPKPKPKPKPIWWKQMMWWRN